VAEVVLGRAVMQAGSRRPRALAAVTPARAARSQGPPSTQPDGYGVATDACPLAPPNRYLPARSGCVTVRRADVNGAGRPDLIIVYSRLGRQHPPGYVATTPPLRDEFVATGAFLKVVLANGTSVSTRINGTRGTRAAAIDSVARVTDDPGDEIFLEVGRISSGATGVAYGFHNGRARSRRGNARVRRRLRIKKPDSTACPGTRHASSSAPTSSLAQPSTAGGRRPTSRTHGMGRDSCRPRRARSNAAAPSPPARRASGAGAPQTSARPSDMTCADSPPDHVSERRNAPASLPGRFA